MFFPHLIVSNDDEMIRRLWNGKYARVKLQTCRKKKILIARGYKQAHSITI